MVAAGDDGGGSRRKKRRRVMDTSGSAGRRRPAPAATAVGYFPFPGAASAAASYFPFPGAPVVNPAEKQEEDDEDDDEEDDDENDEDEADEVSVEERARVDAEARRRRLQSTKRRRADEVASAFFASASSGPTSVQLRSNSGPTSDAFKLLASCVSCATAIVCVVALAAPVTDSPTGGGGGAFRHMSGATERAREISRHRLQLQRESKRCRAEVEAHATELTRRRFGCGLRSAPNPPVGSFGVAGPGGEIFWGAEGPIPRGAHRVNELWSEPKSRLASAADAACSLLARASRVCSGGGSGASSSGGATRRGFERATRDLLAAKAGALASAAALLAEPEAANAAGSKRVPALVDALVRCGVGGAGRERLPPRASGADGRLGGVGGRGSFPRGGVSRRNGLELFGTVRNGPEGPGLRSGRSGEVAAARDGTDGVTVVLVRSFAALKE